MSSITEDQIDNSIRPVEEGGSSDEDRFYIREIVDSAKEKEEKKEEDEDAAEIETRAGSHKEQESLLQHLVNY